MKTLDLQFQAHLDTGSTSLAWCWKVTRRDGFALGFTDHDRDLSFEGTVFEAISGFAASEIQTSLGLAVDNLELQGALSSVRITEDDLRAGRYDDAGLEIWRVNWAAPEQRVLVHKGHLGDVSRGELSFTAEIRGVADRLTHALGRTYQRICDADLGDARCTVDIDDNAFKGSLIVTGVTDNRILNVSGLGGFEADWFARGHLVWQGGANEGLTGAVRHHEVRHGTITIILWQAAAFAVEVGDTAVIRAGCDKTFATCRSKFANADNFRGFPHMPGNDVAFSYVVGEDGRNDGGSFFN